MIKGIARTISGISSIATKGKGIGASRKFGIGLFAAGYGVNKLAQNDFTEQYLVGRYGREKGEDKLSTVRGIAGIASVGMMGMGAYRTITGKTPMSDMLKGARTFMKTGSEGLSYMMVGQRHPASKRFIGPALAGVKDKSRWKHAKDSLKDLPSAKELSKKGKSKAWGFLKRHPYMSAALPIGFAGGIGSGLANAHRITRKTPEGNITSVNVYSAGSRAPSMQFANTPGMMRRMSRNAPRIMR